MGLIATTLPGATLEVESMQANPAGPPAFDAYRGFCRENDLDFRLDCLLDVDRATGGDTRDGPGRDTSARTDMTGPQREALVTAHEMGDSDVPP
ncbi:MAG: hypothetical protein V5A28_10605 [Haloarculaceae archaeon]